MKPSDLLLAAAVIGGAIWTYSIKHEAEAAADRVGELRRQIAAEEERIVFLRADWAFLNAPARLERLVGRFGDELELVPVEAHQWVEPFELPAPPLAEDEVAADDAVPLVTGAIARPAPRPRYDAPASIDDLLRSR